ncbi:MAG TPA: RidA family protein [Gaiella sp.]|nr:RidA family protein [Gaiella sp.]
MGRELVNPQALHPAPGFSHITIATGSKLVYFAGQVALDKDFNIVGGGDLRAQTVAAMRNVETAIAEAGVTWDDIVRRTIYTTMPIEYEAITSGIDEVTGGAGHPAQTIVGVTGLAVPGLLIEIECTASV